MARYSRFALCGPLHIHVPFSGISASAFASCQRRSSPDPRVQDHRRAPTYAVQTLARSHYARAIPESHPARGAAPPCRNSPVYTDRAANTGTSHRIRSPRRLHATGARSFGSSSASCVHTRWMYGHRREARRFLHAFIPLRPGGACSFYCPIACAR
jgi:hypothetical protein